jgi:putative ABC transport system permease protein
VLKNCFKIAFRNIIKHNIYSFINISGLAIGMAAFILITLYIQYELSFNKFNKNYNRIYRVEAEHVLANGNEESNNTPYPLAPVLVDNFPEILHAVRLMPLGEKSLSSSGDKRYLEKDGIYADNSLFDIFTFHFIAGNPNSALKKPLTIVLTKSLADKYFPDSEPIGKILKYDKQFDCKVTGVIENLALNSDIQFSYILSFPSRKVIIGYDYANDWDSNHLHTYILLSHDYSYKEVSKKIYNVVNNFGHTHPRNLFIKPLSKIHLYQSNNEGFSKIKLIFLFGTMALFILLIACINFINMTMAYASSRTKEIGIKKVVGSNRLSLIIQFLSESVILSIISIIIAFLIVDSLIPVFNNIIHRELQINLLNNYMFILGMFFTTLFVGIISGSYPAFMLSSFQAIKILKNPSMIIGKNTGPRKILVVFQTIITIVFMIASLVIYKQMDFMKNKELGFDKEHIVICDIETNTNEQIRRNEFFKNELLKNLNIEKVTFSYGAPFYHDTNWDFHWEGADNGETMVFPINNIDHDFIDTYGMEIIAGRNFKREIISDKDKSCIINETAAKKFGWIDNFSNSTNFRNKYQSAIGKKIIANGQDEYIVIGVVKDFHQQSTYFEIEPFFMNLIGDISWQYNMFSIKVRSPDLMNTLNYIKSKFEYFFPNTIFNYRFLDEDFDRETFDLMEGIVKTSAFFTLLSILIGLMGLLGLVSFIVSKKTKEIGIRKVVGASVPNILLMYAKHFVKWMFIANIIAWPVAYFVMKKWLQNFAYRIDLTIWPFLLAGLSALVIAILTVSWQAFRAATANPVESLRYE